MTRPAASRLLMGGCALALCGWLLALPRGDDRTIAGEVAEIDGDTVSIAARPATLLGRPHRVPIAPVLARQLRVGDVISAEFVPGPDGRRISKVRFLQRAAPPPEPAPDDGSLPMGALLPALAVPGIDGPFLLGVGQGTPTVLAFFFTSCGVPTACPMLAHKLRRLQDEIRGHGRIVTITLDPDVDNLPALRGYGAVHGVDRGTWKLGRLEEAALVPLLRQAGVPRVRSGDQLLHGLHLTLLDGQGRLVWRSDGNTWEAADLAIRVRALRADQQAGTTS